jgi:hypothetical protein
VSLAAGSEPTVDVRAHIVRACAQCGGKRLIVDRPDQFGAYCPSCDKISGKGIEPTDRLGRFKVNVTRVIRAIAGMDMEVCRG